MHCEREKKSKSFLCRQSADPDLIFHCTVPVPVPVRMEGENSNGVSVTQTTSNTGGLGLDGYVAI
jgi:hypothetical protein